MYELEIESLLLARNEPHDLTPLSHRQSPTITLEATSRVPECHSLGRPELLQHGPDQSPCPMENN